MQSMRFTLALAVSVLLAGCCCRRECVSEVDTDETRSEAPLESESHRFLGLGITVLDPGVTAVAYRVYSANSQRPSKWRCVGVQLGRAVDIPPNMQLFRDVYHVEFKYRKDDAWHGPWTCEAPCRPGPCTPKACGTIAKDGTVKNFNCTGSDCPNPFAQTPRIPRCPDLDGLNRTP